MEIIDQSWEILEFPQFPGKFMEIAGRTCYKSDDKIGCTIPEKEFSPDYCAAAGLWDDMMGGGVDCNPSCPHHTSHKFVQKLLVNKHLAMLEFGSACVRFITDRGVTHELVRHRMASYGQESTRWCDYAKADGVPSLKVIWPVDFTKSSRKLVEWCLDKWNKGESYCEPWVTPKEGVEPLPWNPSNEDKKALIWFHQMLNAEKGYMDMRALGSKPQQARSVLPNSLKTEIVMYCNLREWMHVFALRSIGVTGPPHPQIRDLMDQVLMEFAKRFPAMFGPLAEERTKALG